MALQSLALSSKAVLLFKRTSGPFSQSYQLLDLDKIALIFCENQERCIGANFYFSLSNKFDKESQSYFGKSRGNFTGSLYHLFDDGAKSDGKIKQDKWRTSLASIEYEDSFMGAEGPRRLKVTTPNYSNE